MKKLILSLFAATAAFLSGSDAVAQERMIGTLQRAGSGFTLKEFNDPAVRLVTSQRLRGFVGDIVDLRATFQDATTVLVEAIEEARSYFVASSRARLGGQMQMRIRHSGPANFFVFVGFDAGVTSLAPYGPDVAGCLWLDPGIIETVVAGQMNGCWSTCLRIPSACKYLGLDLHFQAAVHSAPAPLLFLNRQTLRITN